MEMFTNTEKPALSQGKKSLGELQVPKRKMMLDFVWSHCNELFLDHDTSQIGKYWLIWTENRLTGFCMTRDFTERYFRKDFCET